MTNGAQNFVMVGERTNVTGSARFRKLIEANDYAAALEVAPVDTNNRQAEGLRSAPSASAQWTSGPPQG